MAATLNANELAVLTAAAAGDTYAVIGARLGLCEKAVSKIAVRAGRKLGATNIANAVFLACRAGILDGRPQRHGDHAGYEAHRRRGETPCEACKVGERAHRSRYKGRQKASAGVSGPN